MERHSKGVHEFAPDAIIIVPTRELAIQIADITRKLYAGSEMRVQAFFHNTAEQQAYKRKRQLAAMLARAKKGVNIMVSTVGFLNFLRKYNVIEFDYVSFLVFDEVDELFDVNFQDDILLFLHWGG